MLTGFRGMLLLLCSVLLPAPSVRTGIAMDSCIDDLQQIAAPICRRIFIFLRAWLRLLLPDFFFRAKHGSAE